MRKKKKAKAAPPRKAAKKKKKAKRTETEAENIVVVLNAILHELRRLNDQVAFEPSKLDPKQESEESDDEATDSD